VSNFATHWAWKQKFLTSVKCPDGSTVRGSTLRLVLLAYAERADEFHCAYPSQKRLAVDTLLDRKTIILAIQALQKLGFMRDTGARKGRTNSTPIYQLSILEDGEAVPIPEHLSGPNNGTGPNTGTTKQSQYSHGSSPNTGTCKQSQYWDQESISINQSFEPLSRDNGVNNNQEPKHFDDLDYVPHPCPPWLDVDAWKDWAKYCIEKRRPLAFSQMKIHLALLEQHPTKQREIISQAIGGGWTDLRPLKAEKTPHSRAQTKDEAMAMLHEKMERARARDSTHTGRTIDAME